VMVASPSSARIDEFLPHYDFSAAHEIRIHAPVSLVYQCLLHCDFNNSRLVRILISLRSGRRTRRKSPPPTDFRRRLEGTGFVILAETLNDEIVIGVAGRFWRPDGGRRMDLPRRDFVNFCSPGEAKAAWNFKVHADSPESSILSTETRVQCFGQAALFKFRLYWSLVRLFSGLIRKAILRQVKTDAESATKSPLH
jgi:hypothetical protein